MEVTTKLAALREEYAGATQLRRAEIERGLWDGLALEDKRRLQAEGVTRNAWLTAQLGLPNGGGMDRRSALLAIGDAAYKLWLRIETDLTLRAAYNIALTAKRSRTTDETMGMAIERALAEYDALPNRTVRPDGKVCRYKREPPAIKSGGQKRPEVVLPAASFWGQLRALVEPYVQERLAGLPPMLAAREQSNFMTELDSVIATAQARLDWVRRDATEKPSPVLLRRSLTDACQTLKLDPPARGKTTEAFMKAARRSFRSLAKEYHPDRRGNATRPQYEAVVEAWSALERYHEHTKGSS